jgi:NaMN:DMB phosphoribosyltransferase
MLAALTAMCVVTHARAFPLFTTKFVLPDNSESQP